jgi:hypothetical protein
LIWYYKRKRPGNTTQVHRGTVALQKNPKPRNSD